MSATTVLDPADAIRALSAELHDALRQLLDGTDREDPTLLDKLRSLSSGLGRKLTNARKRAEQPTPLAPREPTATSTTTTTPAASSSTSSSPVTTTASPTVVPAAKPRITPTTGAVTVPLTAPPTRPAAKPRHQLPSGAAPIVTVPATGDKRGRHRARPSAPHRRSPRGRFWAAILLLLGVAAAAVLVHQPMAGIVACAAAGVGCVVAVARSTDCVGRRARVGVLAAAATLAVVLVAVAAGRAGAPPTAPGVPSTVTTLGGSP